MIRTEAEVEKLVRDNMGLVHHCARKFGNRYRHGIEVEDLVSFGMLGLLSAARAWDPARGAFSTLAVLAIRRSITDGLMREHKPEQAARTVSFDQPGGEGDDWSIVELIPDPAQDVERDVETSHVVRAVRSAMSQLLPQQRRLIGRMYGREGVSLSDVARETGVSRQAVHCQREHALKRLRNALQAWS